MTIRRRRRRGRAAGPRTPLHAGLAFRVAAEIAHIGVLDCAPSTLDKVFSLEAPPAIDPIGLALADFFFRLDELRQLDRSRESGRCPGNNEKGCDHQKRRKRPHGPIGAGADYAAGCC